MFLQYNLKFLVKSFLQFLAQTPSVLGPSVLGPSVYASPSLEPFPPYSEPHFWGEGDTYLLRGLNSLQSKLGILVIYFFNCIDSFPS